MSPTAAPAPLFNTFFPVTLLPVEPVACDKCLKKDHILDFISTARRIYDRN